MRYERLVLALGSVARTLPVPGLAEHALGFNDLADAIALRNHVLAAARGGRSRRNAAEPRGISRSCSSARATPVSRRSPSSTTSSVTRSASTPRLRAAPQRWVLVEAASGILHELSPSLGGVRGDSSPAAAIEVRRLDAARAAVDAESATLSDGDADRDPHLVWTAGVRAQPGCSRDLGAPGRRAGPRRVSTSGCGSRQGRRRVGRRGTAPRVANNGPPGHRPTDQPARPPSGTPLAKNLGGKPGPMPTGMIGQGATLGPVQGVAEIFGIRLRGSPRLVRDAVVPPLPAAALHPKAPGGRGLDGRDVLPARHRAARHARAPQATRLTQVPRPGGRLGESTEPRIQKS